MATLEEKKRELREFSESKLEEDLILLELDHNMRHHYGDRYHQVYMFDGTPHMHIDCNTKRQLGTFLNDYTPIKNHFTTGNDKERVESAYKVHIKSHCIAPHHKLMIEFLTEDGYMQVTLGNDLIELLKPLLTLQHRNLTDSEHHYFTGVSTAGLNRMQIPVYRFRGQDRRFYGGYSVLIDPIAITELISHLIPA